MEFRYDLPERHPRICTPLTVTREPRVFAPDELFQFGIEEEYFLADSETFTAPTETPDALFHSADCCATGRIGREFLQAQIEVATEPHCKMLMRRGLNSCICGRARHLLPRNTIWRSWLVERIRWRCGAIWYKARKTVTRR